MNYIHNLVNEHGFEMSDIINFINNFIFKIGDTGGAN
ncbi:hypothetical protein BCM02_1262 [Paenibacillus methanolicus]|uniref:Uncharacterized protein n=1 Tax=Paenibacillus methanolicus TaxID=582686 RepID=A0A5S5BM69_9BACL|nr:hypothetical protein BCM02_1262 [Paenibacillus methanolicus]